MKRNHDSGGTVPAAYEGQSAEETAPRRERVSLPGQPASPARVTRPDVRRRRTLRIMSLILLLALLFALVRLISILSAADDQLLVRIGNQERGLSRPAPGFANQSLPLRCQCVSRNKHQLNGPGVYRFYELQSCHHHGITQRTAQPATLSWRRLGRAAPVLSYDQLNAFSVLLSQVGAEGMVQVRLSGPVGHSGNYVALLVNRATLAGDWVDYMNNPRSSLRKGKYAHAPFHPIKFWTVGNEPDRLLNPDTGKPFTVAEYTNAFIQFSLAMHQNNPAIQVFGPELSQFYGVGDGPTDPDGQLWMERFLKGVGAYEQAHPELKFHLLDGVSFHFYPFADASKAPAALLSSADELNYLLPPLRQTDPAGPRARCAPGGDRNQHEPHGQCAHPRHRRALVGRHPGCALRSGSGVYRVLLGRGDRYTLSLVYQRWAAPDGDVARAASVLPPARHPHSYRGTKRPGEPVCHPG